MGSGSRFKVRFMPTMFCVGVYVDRFPFAVTVMVYLPFVVITLGFGKGYDE